MEKKFPKQIDRLDEMTGFVQSSLTELNVPEEYVHPIAFILEELFTNTVKYNGSSRSDVVLSIGREGDRLIVTVRDHTAAPFNPLQHKDPDPGAPLEGRTPGGLGIFLVKKIVDDIRYEYANGESVITIVKNLNV